MWIQYLFLRWSNLLNFLAENVSDVLVFQYHQRQNKACSVSEWQPGKGNQKMSSHSLPIFTHLMACAQTLRHMKSKQHSELELVLLQDREVTLRVASKCAAQALGLQLKFPTKFLDAYRSVDFEIVNTRPRKPAKAPFRLLRLFRLSFLLFLPFFRLLFLLFLFCCFFCGDLLFSFFFSSFFFRFFSSYLPFCIRVRGIQG